MPKHNEIIIASAGSGKTTELLRLALEDPNKRVLITTYTNENLNQIVEKILKKHSVIPDNIKVISWFSFLLAHGVRPCSSHMTQFGINSRIEGLQPVSERSGRLIKITNRAFWTTKDYRIYSDKLSQFACMANHISDGLVIERLQNHFDHVFIDEVQDFSGYDLDFLELLLRSQVPITCVGDPRQVVYQTSPSARNSPYRGGNIVTKFTEWEKEGLCTIVYRNNSKRCGSDICKLSDTLFPSYPTTTSENASVTGHDGIFLVREEQVERYIQDYPNTVVLRSDIATNTQGLPSINFGKSKGRTYQRVLIFCHGPLLGFLAGGEATIESDQTRSKIYVAITRAEQSVAFVTNDPCCYDYVQRAYENNWQATLF